MKRIPLSEKEMARLIEETTKNKQLLDVAFGTSGIWIEWDEKTPVPWSLELLCKMRGVANQNVGGDGI